MIDSFHGKYYWLSNFSLFPVKCSCKICNGIVYATVENLYQAHKTLDLKIRKEMALISPGDAKKIGRLLKVRPDWEDVKVNVMDSALRIKFKDGVPRQLLMLTGKQALIEGNVWGDTFWGVCCGKGQNVLGKLLMKIRREMLLQ